MKVIDIALKDLLGSFRNAIALVFMFVIPIAVTVLFYFMFGNIAGDGEFNVPKTRVILVNLDRGSPQFQEYLSAGGGSASLKGVDSLGGIIQVMLKSPEFSTVL